MIIGLLIWYFQPAALLTLSIIFVMVSFLVFTQKNSKGFIPLLLILLTSDVLGQFKYIFGFQEIVYNEEIIISIVMISFIFLELFIFFLTHINLKNKVHMWKGLLLMILACAISGVREFEGMLNTNHFSDTIVMLIVLFAYLFFALTLEKGERRYIAKSFLYLGLYIALQIAIWDIIYFRPNEIEDVALLRPSLRWGSINVGALLMLLGFGGGIYLYIDKPQRWVYFILQKFILIAVFLSTSRGGALAGGVAWIISDVYLLVVLKNRKPLKLLYTGFIAFLLVLLVVFFEPINELVAVVLGRFNYDGNMESFSSTRLIIYRKAWQVFISSPIVGVGTALGVAFNKNPWFHSTILELLASVGIIGTLLFSYHFLQKYHLIIKNIKDPFVFSLYIGLGASCGYGLIDVTYSNFIWLLIVFVFLAGIETQLNVETLSVQKQ